MRLTVGPLAAGVYWRRRLFVLVGFVLLVIGVWTAFSGASPSSDAKTATHPSSTPSTSGILTPTIEPSTASPSPSRHTSVPSAPPPTGKLCIDAELSLTPSATPNPAKVGAPTALTFVIRNISGRTCDRDVGGLPQELRIMQGETLIWSSDHCRPTGTSFVRTFKPGESVKADVVWDGRKTVRDGKVECANPPPADMRAEAGNYLLVGRLDDAYSQAVPLEVDN